ncbi:hypothetical protein [Sporolactobacillus vineae]|uniref:hypothetical protein n=1 Tax=Sporolactobacillus vineae TaxID=444463 RepID=UPI000287EA61|nr:hypothetical protein [Sporolactobacillus vineae]
MRQAVVFGGLSACGLPLSEALMNQGVAVCALSSALTRQEKANEAERGYILGRNALFQTVDETLPLPCGTVFIADSFRTRPDVNQLLQDKIGQLTDVVHLKKWQRLIVMSSLEAAGNDASVNHAGSATAEREAAEAMEAFLISAVPGAKTLIFFRTRRSEMCRRGSQASKYMAAFYFADCHGLSRWAYDPDAGADTKANKDLNALLGEPGNDEFC